jgi:hypothetical protein
MEKAALGWLERLENSCCLYKFGTSLEEMKFLKNHHKASKSKQKAKPTVTSEAS